MAESENWQFEKSALECHKYMLDHSIATDVTFVVSNKMFSMNEQTRHYGDQVETFKAHKYQMICRSPVFYAMFYGDLAEKGNIIIDDIDPGAFRQMLNYIYTDQAEMKTELAFPLLYASKKYLLTGLTKICVDYLEKSLSANNACILFDHSLLFDEQQLCERSVDLIKSQTNDCLKAPSLNLVQRSTLSKILDFERLASPEIDVYCACERWAKYQVEQSGQKISGTALRQVLGECVFKIRYPVMRFEEFGTVVAPTEILLAEEEIAIFRYFASKNNTQVSQKFRCENRFLTGIFTVVYDRNCTELSTTSCTTTFEITADQSVSLKYLTIGEIKSGSTKGGSTVPLNCSEIILDGIPQPVPSVQNSRISELCLDTPITLNRNRKRTLQIRMKVVQSYPSAFKVLPILMCSTTRDMNISDKTTGLHISVSSNNHMFLHGFTYDYNRL